MHPVPLQIRGLTITSKIQKQTITINLMKSFLNDLLDKKPRVATLNQSQIKITRTGQLQSIDLVKHYRNDTFVSSKLSILLSR